MPQKPVKKSHFEGIKELDKINNYLVDMDRDMFNFYQYFVNFPRVYRQTTQPTLTEDGIALWNNTTTSKFYWIVRINGTQKALDFDAASGSGADHSTLTNLTYATAGHTGFQATLSTGNMLGSAPISIAGGDGAVIGGGALVSISQASTSNNGYLNSADWGTFYNKADYLFGTNNFSGTGNFVTSGGISSNTLSANTFNVISLTATNLSANTLTAGSGTINVLSGNTLNINGQVYGKGFFYNVTIVASTSANYNATSKDDLIQLQGTTTCNLPASTGSGKSYYINNFFNTTGNALVIANSLTEYIEGSTAQVLYPGEGIHVIDMTAHYWSVV